MKDPSPPPGGAVTSAARAAVVPSILFALTLLSTTAVGALSTLGPGQSLSSLLSPSVLSSGLVFSLPLCAILLFHEMGHYLMARYHGIPVSLPYFIPLPLPPIGTMGAIIGLKGEVRNRNTLCDIAAAGPLSGLFLALPLLYVGLRLSTVGPLLPGDMVEGQSLLYLGMKYLAKGQILPGEYGGQVLDVKLHPMAFAAWVGLFITMINLVPIGQLDGGRVAAAYFGKDHEQRGNQLHRGLLILALIASLSAAWQAANGQVPQTVGSVLIRGLSAGFFWILWAAALLVMRKVGGGRWHPEVDPDPLSPGRRLVALGLLITLVLLYMPYHMREAT